MCSYALTRGVLYTLDAATSTTGVISPDQRILQYMPNFSARVRGVRWDSEQ
jgi:hypothetical protein